MESRLLSADGWVNRGQQHGRSKRITPATWDRYKPLLCKLYKEYTLDKVMGFMKQRFGFTPSKRQYGYRFEKWNIRKYTGAGVGRAMDQGEDSVIDNSLVNLPRDIRDILDTLERPRSPATPSDNDNGYPSDDDVSSVSALSSAEETKKLAAEFCFSVSDDDNAFRLMYDLFQTSLADPEADPAAKDMLAFSSARAANGLENAQLARQLLTAYQTLHRDAPRRFLFAMLQAYVQDRHESPDQTAATSLVCQVMKSILVEGTALPEVEHCYTVIDLVTYQLLVYGSEILQAHGQLPAFSMESTINSYVYQQPLPRVIRGNESTPLALCIRWCAAQLDHIDHVPLEVQLMQCDAGHRLYLDNLQLFCTLWYAILSSIRNDDAPSWHLQCESALGISSSELLVTVCWLLGESTASHIDATILTRATTQAYAMARQPEPELWAHFLDKFAWMNKPVSPNQEDRSFEAAMLSHVRSFVSSALSLSLPVPSSFPYSDYIGNMAGLDFLDQLDFHGDDEAYNHGAVGGVSDGELLDRFGTLDMDFPQVLSSQLEDLI